MIILTQFLSSLTCDLAVVVYDIPILRIFILGTLHTNINRASGGSFPKDVPHPLPRSNLNSSASHNRSMSETMGKELILSSVVQSDRRKNSFDCNTTVTLTNGCMPSRESLLEKSDAAVASLVARLEQVANQCTAAQIRGGGNVMCEEKFQVCNKSIKYLSVIHRTLH